MNSILSTQGGFSSFEWNCPMTYSVEERSGDADHFAQLMALMGGAPPLSTSEADLLHIGLQRVHEGAVLFHEGMKAHALYFVRAGTFKSFHITEDGYEQVVSFASRSEVLGYDAIYAERHPTSAVALEESSIYVLPTRDVFKLGRYAPDLDRLLRLSVSHQLKRYGELADLMSSVASEARLSRFLLQLSQRMREQGQSPTCFYLRMSRRDIASYLGVAHETVSRSFGLLAKCGYLVVDRREVEILNMDGLKACALGSHRSITPQQASVRTHPKPIRPWIFAGTDTAALTTRAHE